MGKNPVFACLALLLVLSIPTYAQESKSHLEFSVPAQTQGHVQVDRLQWAILIFDEETTAGMRLEMPGSAVITNYTKNAVEAKHPSYADASVPTDMPSAIESYANLTASVDFQGSWASLVIQAESLLIDTAQSWAQISLPGPYEPSSSTPSGVYRLEQEWPREGISFDFRPYDANSTQFSLEAHGVRRVEWHNATTTRCQASPCPDGGRTQPSTITTPVGHIRNRLFSYIELQGSGGSLLARGTAGTIAAAGNQVDAAIHGWSRFPHASLEESCGDIRCTIFSNGTLQVEGALSLVGMTVVEGQKSRVVSKFEGELRSARLDELPIDSLLTPGFAGAAVAGVAGAIVLGKLLLGLFARSSRSPLEHPKAKAIHGLVLAQPGISFGGIEKATGWGHGTVQYHVKRLLKAGLVVGYGYRNSVRFFENHGRHKHDWEEHAALRKPQLRRLHEWIAANPGSTQARVVGAAAEWGWKRSTTQHYLRQLEEARLLRPLRSAAGVEYTAVRPGASQAGPGPAGA